MERLRAAIRNGCDIHPGANYVTAAKVGFKKYLKFGNRDGVADNLKIGDIVERHVIDGEYVPPFTLRYRMLTRSSALSCSTASRVCTR
jgi:hypothetical protein